MSQFLFALNAVLPVFLLILTGIVLRRISMIDEKFIQQSSKLVFKVALPLLIFQKMSRIDFSKVFDAQQMFLVFLLVTGAFLVVFLLSGFFIKDGACRGAFVQGAFRSNTAIVGLAIIINIYGDSGAAQAAIILAIVFPLYNIYSVAALIIPLKKAREKGAFYQVVKAIIKNPLILAVLIALPFSLFSLNIDPVLQTFTGYLAQLTLPLALIGVGGSLSFSAFRQALIHAVVSSSIKLILYPVLVVLILVAVGIKGEALGIIFILLGSPTAVSSYVMAKSMDSDSELAASIIVLTTMGSVITIGGGIFILKLLSLI